MDHQHYTTIEPDRERGQHLKITDRSEIKAYHKLGMSLRAIAKEINCSPSTVMYELRRGTKERTSNIGRPPEYSPNRGQMNYETNRSRCHKPHKFDENSDFGKWMTDKVKNNKWSFDVCVGRARVEHLFPENQIVCCKTLYNELWNANLSVTLFDVPEALKRNTAHHKRLRKNKRQLGRSIDERPKDETIKEEYGHWEIDTVVGKRKGKESVVLTLIEKKSRFFITRKIAHKDADSVINAINSIRREYASKFSQVFKTITSDNGTEFERLSEAEKYGTLIFFAHPYSSWERPQNERHNRILRKYIPKSVSVESFSSSQILQFSDDMNSVPKKILGYKTPEELFEGEFLDKIYSTLYSPAV